MTRMEATAIVLCRQLHTPEWTAPRPRTAPCEDCSGITVLVLETFHGTLHTSDEEND